MEVTNISLILGWARPVQPWSSDWSTTVAGCEPQAEAEMQDYSSRLDGCGWVDIPGTVLPSPNFFYSETGTETRLERPPVLKYH